MTFGETDLKNLLRNAAPELAPDVFVYCTISPHDLPDGLLPVGTFREAEGLTLILQESQAKEHGLAHTFRCAMITLRVHSALEAIGFLAAIMQRLTVAGISANTVSAYYHDHLFVPVEKAEAAMAILRELASD